MNNTAKATTSSFPKTLPLITKREIEVLQLVAIGMSSAEIAPLLFISQETVKSHRKNMRRKLDACNGASLVRAAFEYGVLSNNK